MLVSFSVVSRRFHRPRHISVADGQLQPRTTALHSKPPLTPSGHAARVHSFTVPHATLPPALSQYRRTGNPERFGFIAAPNWFASPAHFVNGRGHSSSVEFGLSVFHMCPQHVVSQFHTDPMLLSFSVVRRFHHGHWHTCVADCHQWCVASLTPRVHPWRFVVSPAPAWVQNSRVRACHSREILLSSLHADL